MEKRLLKRILVANRGEIACRLIKTIHALGKETVSVYSEVDKTALHVLLATKSVALGGTTPQESYLKIDALINAAQKTACDGIHPGYGFLSENPLFAKACQDAGIVFIGPSHQAIEAMGSKSEAKKLMQQAGVPLMPGYHGTDQSDDTLLSHARQIGFPILLKAAAGGGGRGMRIVESEESFLAALATARRESLSAFHDDKLLLEKYFPTARHIEVQVLADSSGEVAILFERDCSLQRRHQKIVEEAPAPLLKDATRTKLFAAAKKAAQAVNYTNAGTVEFLMDTQENFYFMEMNTRLQVEHPVTEMITGIDLVAAQIKVAEGALLEELCLPTAPNGHAIEARLYAEDAEKGFLPVSGTVDVYREPVLGSTVRIDSGVTGGSVISPYYDSMIAKVIAYGSTREEAREQLCHALCYYHIAGLITNREFLLEILKSDLFNPAHLRTTSVGEYVLAERPEPSLGVFSIASYLFAKVHRDRHEHSLIPPWNTLTAYSNTHSPPFLFELCSGETVRSCSCTFQNCTLRVASEGESFMCEILNCTENVLKIVSAGVSETWSFYLQAENLHLFSMNGEYFLVSPKQGDTEKSEAGSTSGHYTAPMTGTLIKVLVSKGAEVVAGTPLAIVEAMKMEHTITATASGKVISVPEHEGASVQQGVLLVEIALDSTQKKEVS